MQTSARLHLGNNSDNNNTLYGCLMQPSAKQWAQMHEPGHGNAKMPCITTAMHESIGLGTILPSPEVQTFRCARLVPAAACRKADVVKV